ncbi:hypothetical protein CASFOL_019948 [Castilleja foliolosa]|uniref:KIB1-4 beta-propeller domain-containing protein n=1 Tax=Castilleja foliolosa TaxID=1961234 RepID=A0ABD3D1H3_9LAMI
MGEKKMIKKERKLPSQKKVEPAAVDPLITRRSKFYYNRIPISCPSFSRNYEKYYTIEESISGSGVITKSWISSRCSHQTWPQLAETNIYPKDILPPFHKDFLEHEKMAKVDNLYETEGVINITLWKDYGEDLDIPLQMSAPLERPRVVITGISSPAFAYYKLVTKDTPFRVSFGCWSTRDCRITEPYSDDNRYMEFTNVIGFQGTYYAISRQGSLVLIEHDGDSGNYEITSLGRRRVVPNCRVSKHFREYLLEYEGEIYVVFLLSILSIKVVDNVEVLRLNKSRLLLEKVDHLVGDAMFFVQDDRCMGISASLLGCSKGSNCVYFTHDRADDTWFVFDMKSGCISTTSGPEIDLI